MRNIEIDAIRAFMSCRKFSRSNTAVSFDGYNSVLWLHNNPIAYRDAQTGRISIQTCGWFSVTTKSRLNAIPGVSINQMSYKWYLNGKQWDGKLIEL